MKTRWWIILGVIIAAGVYFGWRLKRPKPLQFVTMPATMGDVIRSIITTGSVNPVVTVQVGSYVSGPIQALYCDYNTKVKAGQLCAKIDPKPFQVALDQAKANLASAQAQLAKDQAGLAYAKSNYERDLGLLGQGIVSQDTVDSDKSTYQQASAQVELDQATILQRRAALEAAQVNLNYTNIVSPVDGTVVSRNVNVGQTVAASFQTPTLFLIAQDLTKMQVDTNVSESDIGGVRIGQKAVFTVEAFPKKTFHGQVSQVREAPITVQNVVTYDAVISVDNPELLLLPGMTATARIITEERNHVLRVPLQALHINPPRSSTAPGQETTAGRIERQVWILRAGRPVPVPVTVGLEDGTYGQITGGNLKAGDPVIVGEIPGESRSGKNGQRSRFPFRF
jgi:HlyD family secretion protein